MMSSDSSTSSVSEDFAEAEAELRVHDGQVVGVDEVLRRELPVRLDFVLVLGLAAGVRRRSRARAARPAGE